MRVHRLVGAVLPASSRAPPGKKAMLSPVRGAAHPRAGKHQVKLFGGQDRVIPIYQVQGAPLRIAPSSIQWWSDKPTW